MVSMTGTVGCYLEITGCMTLHKTTVMTSCSKRQHHHVLENRDLHCARKEMEILDKRVK